MNPARFHPPKTGQDARRDARKIFDEIFSRIWLALDRYDIPRNDRSDLAQDILLAALESADRYDPARGAPLAWLQGIIHNHMLRYWERQAKERRRFVPADQGDGAEPDETADTARGALELLMFDEKRRLAHQLYREIPFEQLSVLIDHDLEELTLQEIAEQRGVSISTIHDRYNAAHRKLQAALQRWEAKHRERGVLVLPLSVKALLAADRVVPDAPEDVRDHMWRRFSQAVGPAQGRDGGRPAGDDGRRPRASAPPPPIEGPGPIDKAVVQGIKGPESWGAMRALPTIGALVVGLVGGGAIVAALRPAHAPAARDEAPSAAVSAAVTISEQATVPSAPASKAPPIALSAATPASAGRAGPIPVDSEALLREEAAFDTARTAFMQGNMIKAIDALAVHARNFPRGQHAAERDKMWIDALLALGDKDEACKRADRFRRTYPGRGALPAVGARCPAKE